MFRRKTGGERHSPKPFVIAAYVLAFLTFGALGGWAATAPLDSAVVSNGVLSVESSKKVVDHLEGGIVKQILVKNGDEVKAGDVLIRLSEVQAKAEQSMLGKRLKIARAEAARLEAERSLEPTLEFPPEIADSTDPQVQHAVKTQLDLFKERTSVLNSQIDIENSKIEQLTKNIHGLELQRDATEKEMGLIEGEVTRLAEGQGKGVVSMNKLSEFQRTEAELSGTYGGLISKIASAQESVSEDKLEIVKLRQSFSERAADELQDLREQLTELEEKEVIAADTLRRVDIRAPVDGVVQNLQVHTVGGVVKSGAPLLEIVPKDEELVINAQIGMLDINSVHPGLKAEVRLPSFKNRYMHPVFGVLDYISPDTITPENTDQSPYYQARILVKESEFPAEMRDKLSPGMPAEVIIPTGERTALQYLLQPFQDAFRKSLNED
ncbi:HlyD family type I secretion periplasmic adaptor subunit [Roseibium sp. RKSG952]|uniref:HlyD family type I secretion periplasmic adaptor subunit n=1 Tax=Roseibium sp. RKSG952 TaxID=2529384 RepID=UPI0012BD1452|nr:HlyD family type I secretion periplasmic adaptor subunit [Roseibium sp. RKSG952]MTH95152.1 HlyD family type I secretion periplasmic adaptor subunit [Roseibium sp. RKSG952]